MKCHLLRFARRWAIIVPLGACLVAVGPATAAQFGSLAPTQADTFVSLAEGNSPEGIAIHKDSMYVGNRRTTDDGLVSEILRIDPDGNISPFASFGAIDASAEGILGLAIGPQGDVLAAVSTLDQATYTVVDPTKHGVWRIGGDGVPHRVPGSEAIVFPNALAFDARGNLYVTDSRRGESEEDLSGGIWRFAPDGTGELWLEHASLSPFTFEHPLGVPPVGANGIAFHPPDGLYVANTQVGQIVNVPINPDGSPGEPQVVAGGFSLLTIDGIAVDVTGHIHGVLPGFAVATALASIFDLPIPPDGMPPVVEVNPATGEVARSSLAEFDELFDFPLSLAFDGKSVFAANGSFELEALGLPPGFIFQPGPSIVEVGVDTPGFPTFGDGLAAGMDTAVPEPSTMALLVTGLGLLTAWTSGWVRLLVGLR